MTKYRTIFQAITGETIHVDIGFPDYVGSVILYESPVTAPVTLERQGDYYGVMGTACRVRIINGGQVDVTDFLVNSSTGCSVDVYKDSVLQFTGFLVLDDITQELRTNPVELELTFADNVALLSDIECPFVIDNTFTSIISIIRDLLALTGLDLPVNVFHAPYPDTGDDLSGTFEQCKILPRTFAQSLQSFDKAKDALNKILTDLRCRLFQHGGEWYVIRVYDCLYNTTMPGFRYDGSDIGVATTLNATPVTNLTMLQFSQAVTYQRAVSKVSNSYKFDPGFQLFNADLQDLGSLVSTTVDGLNTIYRYNIPSYWFLDGSMTAFIEVVRVTLTDTEVDRYLLLPFLNVGQLTADGLRFNKILVSEGDFINLSGTQQGQSNSNFAARFSYAALLEGVSGTRYELGIGNAASVFAGRLSWDVSLKTPDTVQTQSFGKEVAGRVDNTEVQPFDLAVKDGSIDRLPEDGQLTLKLAGYKNNDSRLGDINAEIRDLNFIYEFLVNSKLLIEGQKHTSNTATETLNLIENDLTFDQSIKYNPIGQIYNSTNEVFDGFMWPDGGGYSAPIGELNNREELIIKGAPKRVISGLFQGTLNMTQVFGYDGATWLIRALTTDFATGQCSGEFVELVSGSVETYNFDYIYKPRE